MTTTNTHTDNGLVDETADAARSKVDQVRSAVGDAADRVPEVLETARTNAERAAAQLPDAADRARTGLEDTTTRLQTLPDDSLRVMAAASIGLAAGLFLAGAPRLVALMAATPALFAGAAIATRSR